MNTAFGSETLAEIYLAQGHVAEAEAEINALPEQHTERAERLRKRLASLNRDSSSRDVNEFASRITNALGKRA